MDEATKRDYLKLTPTKRLDFLKRYALSLPAGTQLSEVQTMLFRLECDERKYESQLEAHQFVPPSEYDVFILDITDDDLARVSIELCGLERLSIATDAGSFPARGMIYGGANRVFVSLVVSKRTSSVHVTFLVDTGSPNTHLRKDTLEALGFKESIPSNTVVHINGIGLTVYPSRSHFENVDLIGQDFFIGWAVLNIDYCSKEVIIARRTF
jgi:hypothetical protein